MSLSEDLDSRESIGGKGDRGDTVIHVIDDLRQIRKDFFCKQSQLLEHMKYFEACLAGVSPDDEVEISVHCDIKVFEWLAEYMDGSRQVTDLDTKDVVSILISADFLQMNALVDECIDMMYTSLSEILTLPLDLGCLPERLVMSLAERFDESTLEKLQDSHDRLKSRLYAHKLRELLSVETNVLFCCSRCHRLFTFAERSSERCVAVPVSGLEGMAKSPVPTLLQHAADATWDVGEYLHQLREIHSWSQLFWKVWARLQHFHCRLCQTTFCGLELHQCKYHSDRPVSSEGTMGDLESASEPGLGRIQLRSHEPLCPSEAEAMALECILRHQEDFCLQDPDPLLVVPLRSKESKGASKAEDLEEERMPELWARYCCEPAPEHSATAETPISPGPLRRRRPRSAPRTPRGEVDPSAVEYRLQRSPYQDASGFQNLFVEDLAEAEINSSRGPSFFEPKLPKGVSVQRKLHHMMDVLREDDRRRMDELTAKIYACRAKTALAKAQLSSPSSATIQAQKLAWMLQGWSAEAKSANRPQRRQR